MARRSHWLAVGAICLLSWGCALVDAPKEPESPWIDEYMHLSDPSCLSKSGVPVDAFQAGWQPYCVKAAKWDAGNIGALMQPWGPITGPLASSFLGIL
jgi:hypothetical protein